MSNVSERTSANERMSDVVDVDVNAVHGRLSFELMMRPRRLELLCSFFVVDDDVLLISNANGPPFPSLSRFNSLQHTHTHTHTQRERDNFCQSLSTSSSFSSSSFSFHQWHRRQQQEERKRRRKRTRSIPTTMTSTMLNERLDWNGNGTR